MVTIKRAREVLQEELASQVSDLESLAAEVTFRKRELRTALDTMRVARDHAEQASRAKSDFLSLVSHELRTPLTAIRTYLHLLAREGAGSLAPRQRSIVEKTARSSARLLSLVESLLEYVRAESGRLVTDVAPVDLGALVGDVVEEMRPLAEQKLLALHVTTPPALPPLVSDAQLVRLILVNLISNGIKYTDQGGVAVSVSHGEGVHRVSVVDSGPGIPPDRQRLIFEPFTQLEPVRHKHTPGVGLGLALVERMVAALGGRVELRSELGSGSEFTVVLPPAPPQALRASA
jgi:signal transduction histidine kinase